MPMLDGSPVVGGEPNCTPTQMTPAQNIRDAIMICPFSFLLVSWTVVSGAPAALDSCAVATGAPQCGQLAA